jgi:hypothetical protein
METKYCSFCGGDHPFTEEYWCCLNSRPKCKAKVRDYTMRTAEERNKKSRERHKSPEVREKRRQKCSEYYASTKEERLEKQKQYYRDNVETRKEYNKQYWATNKDKLSQYSKRYVNEHKEMIREWKYNYEKEKLAKDIQYKLSKTLRTRLRCALQGNSKAGSAVRDLGCTIEEFRKYIEDKFQEGMSWDNHGLWHLDHIKPLALFDLTDREQLCEACNYSNIQPLWAKDNLRKGARYEEDKQEKSA